jgi:trans-aconitate methyltransferase
VAENPTDGRLASVSPGIQPAKLPGIRPARLPGKIDTSTAHIARVYDFWLGGKDNYTADRAAAGQVIAAYPPILASVRAQRAFLGRAVHYLAADAGIRQFLDIGTGLPADSNTHEVAQRAAPQSRIVYVDNDPIVLAHARALLASCPDGASDYVDADLRDAGKILESAAASLTFDKPVAILLAGILHCIPDHDGPDTIVAQLMAAVPSGSYLVVAHPAKDVHAIQIGTAAARLNHVMSQQVTLRTHAQVCRFFAGLDLLEPGVVQLHRWRPGTHGPVPAGELANYGGVGRKPDTSAAACRPARRPENTQSASESPLT